MTITEALEILDKLQEGMNKLCDENAKLRDALQFIANHEAEPGSALETVVKFARLTLGEDAQ